MQPEDNKVHMMAPSSMMSEEERLSFLSKLVDDESGCKFLRWLCLEVCAYHFPAATLENNATSPNATLCNDARKDVWRAIRPYLHHSKLAMVETFDVQLIHERILERLETLREEEEKQLAEQRLEEEGE